jgi:hypothetical protein
MTHHSGHDPDAIEPVTPFDEATDLLDEEADDDLIQLDRLRIPSPKSLIVLAGVLLSPLFALLFGLNEALGVLVVAMVFTTWVAWDGASRLIPEQAKVLRRAALLNAAIAVLALGLLIVRIAG